MQRNCGLDPASTFGNLRDTLWIGLLESAIMHLGKTLHAALPIESGIRNNIVVWNMGNDGGRGYGGPLTTDDGKYH